ncbi:unnamed protein product [Vitrella brassicaformis CCMP3155]|uniref:ATP-dependent Clp protease proteolytic subunit n=1 Tax=Vitrella brassicaformis (strain CCMP3155) TaxID=1169540 RepID=A0A0G4FFN9_VITBC|nr:unnamed protein product [Vitrella brassicaformis CCMP3155]|eukprot:CEM11688.1 unnamed protein product [Vitrella brassicaformis CCMP3155]
MVRRGGGGGGYQYYEGARLPPPPDLPSLLLSERIVYLGLPLVSQVTELIIAQLLYLEYESADKPILMYINSSGNEDGRGRPVAFETEALALADVMNYVKPPVHTICVGQAFGTAAMLLANGEKGYRYSLPNSTILLKQPVGGTRGQASDIAAGAKEVLFMRNQMVQIISQASGKGFDTVMHDLQRSKYLTAEEAKAYGLIDRVLDSKKDLTVPPPMPIVQAT